MAAQRPFRADVRVDGATQTLAAFKALPKEASEELRKAAGELSELLAARMRAAGAAEGRQAAKLAGTITVKRDRVPAFEIGGKAKIFRGKKDGTRREAFEALFGSEFGMRGHGFKPWRGRAGLWIWPTIEASQAEVAKAWREAADVIVKKFTDGPGGTG